MRKRTRLLDKALEQAAEIRKRDSLEGHRAYGRVYLRRIGTSFHEFEYASGVEGGGGGDATDRREV